MFKISQFSVFKGLISCYSYRCWSGWIQLDDERCRKGLLIYNLIMKKNEYKNDTKIETNVVQF